LGAAAGPALTWAGAAIADPPPAAAPAVSDQFKFDPGYANGARAPLDTNEAPDWHRNRADRAHAETEMNEARDYSQGQSGVPIDQPKALA